MGLGDLQSRLAILISADGQGAIREIKRVGDAADKDLGKATSHIDKLGNRLTYGGAAAMGFAALAGGALYSFAKSADEAHHAELKLQNSMQNSPALANANIESFKKLATAIQNKTAADDNQVISAMSVLARFNLTEQQIKSITPLVVDLSRKLGIDLDTAAKNVGRALDGKATALKKVGIHLNDTLYNTDRLAAVTQGLRGAVGGFAEQEGQTFSGKLERLKNQLNDLKESIGAGVISTIGPLMNGFGGLAKAAGEANDKTGGMIGKIATIGTGVTGAVGALSFLSGMFIKLKGQILAAEGGLTSFGYAATGIAAIGLGFVLFEGLRSLANALEKAKIDAKELGENVKTFTTSGTIQGALKTQIDDYKHLASSIMAVNIAHKQNLDDYKKYAVLVNTSLPAEGSNMTGLYRIPNQVSTRESDDKIKKLDEQLANLVNGGNADAARKLFDDISASAQRGGESADHVRSAFTRYASAQETAKARSADHSASILEQVRSMETLDESAEGAARSISEVYDAAMKFADGARSVEEQTIRLGDQYKKYSEDARAGKLDTDHLTLAQDELIDSMSGIAQKAAEVRITQLGVTDAEQQSIIKHDVMKAKLEELKQKYPELAGKIDEYIRNLDSVPKNVTTNVNVDTSSAERRMQEWADWLRRIGQSENYYGPPSPPPGRAVGGPVMAGAPYMVGERGPEIFVPSSSGRIIPNNVVRSMTPRTGTSGDTAASSNTYNLNVNVSAGTHPAEVGAAVIDAIKAWERRNGTSWKN